MGVRFPSVQSNTFIGPLPASGAETVVLTTPPLTLTLDFAQVILLWAFTFVAGTGTTSCSFRLRRGTTVSGALINLQVPNAPAVAAANANYSGTYFDTPGAVAGQQYSLTIVQNGATAAGTFPDGALIAFAL